MTDLQIFEEIVEGINNIVYGYKKPVRKKSVKKSVKKLEKK